jgi:hypothetical protein
MRDSKRVVLAVLGLMLAVSPASAFVVDPFYSGSYTAADLGSPSGVSTPLGGLTFLAGDPNTILIGGAANGSSAVINSIGVTRDAGMHITGFSGTASQFSTAPGIGFGGIDGGLAYGPSGVLFYTSFSDNSIGQIKGGSSTPDKQTALTALGVSSSVGALQFVPVGFGGAGQLKIVSYDSGDWYNATVASDGAGTFNIAGVTQKVDLGGTDPEGMVYIASGNPQFSNDSILVALYRSGSIVSYEVDANGDPVLATRRTFISGLTGAEGAAIDPLTGDFLFSTFGGGNHVIVVSGFTEIPGGEPVPEPGTLTLMSVGLAGVGRFFWKRRKQSAV